LDIWWNVKSNFVFLVSSGVPTTINYHKLILDVEDFKNGKVDTAFIVKHEEELAEVNSNVSVVG